MEMEGLTWRNLESYSKSDLRQSWKLLRPLGTGCPVGLGIGSRILRVSPAFSIVRRIFAVIYAIFGYFWDNLPDFQHFWTDCGNFGTDFKHHSSVGFGLADQVPSRLRIISRSANQKYLTHPTRIVSQICRICLFSDSSPKSKLFPCRPVWTNWLVSYCVEDTEDNTTSLTGGRR